MFNFHLLLWHLLRVRREYKVCVCVCVFNWVYYPYVVYGLETTPTNQMIAAKRLYTKLPHDRISLRNLQLVNINFRTQYEFSVFFKSLFPYFIKTLLNFLHVFVYTLQYFFIHKNSTDILASQVWGLRFETAPFAHNVTKWRCK